MTKRRRFQNHTHEIQTQNSITLSKHKIERIKQNFKYSEVHCLDSSNLRFRWTMIENLGM